VYKSFHLACLTTRWSGIEGGGHSGKSQSEEDASFNVGNNLNLTRQGIGDNLGVSMKLSAIARSSCPHGFKL